MKVKTIIKDDFGNFIQINEYLTQKQKLSGDYSFYGEIHLNREAYKSICGIDLDEKWSIIENNVTRKDYSRKHTIFYTI